MQALRLKPALDVEFLAYASRRKQESSNSGNGSMSMMHRLSFDKNLQDARRSCLAAAQAQRTFWSRLQDSTPSMSELHTISSVYASQIKAAENAFAELHALSSTSIPVLRLHAQFCEICNNSDRAFALSSEADRIEDARSKSESNGAFSMSNSTGLTLTLLQEASPEIMSVNGINALVAWRLFDTCAIETVYFSTHALSIGLS